MRNLLGNPHTRRRGNSPPLPTHLPAGTSPKNHNPLARGDTHKRTRPSWGLRRGHRHGRGPGPPGPRNSSRYTLQRRFHAVHDPRPHHSGPYWERPYGEPLQPPLHGIPNNGPHPRQHQPAVPGTDTYPSRGHMRRRTGGCCGSGSDKPAPPHTRVHPRRRHGGGCGSGNGRR